VRWRVRCCWSGGAVGLEVEGGREGELRAGALVCVVAAGLWLGWGGGPVRLRGIVECWRDGRGAGGFEVRKAAGLRAVEVACGLLVAVEAEVVRPLHLGLSVERNS
jgi:hypothetical protein